MKLRQELHPVKRRFIGLVVAAVTLALWFVVTAPLLNGQPLVPLALTADFG